MAGEGGAAGKSVGDRTASLAPAAEVPAHDGVSALPAEDASDLRSLLMTSVLNLEKLDADLHRGTHHWVPRTRRLFGGQIIGQALVAAARSVSEDFFAHSLHCYFVRAGDPKVPVLYQVERTRDGRSFLVRSVKAIQHGKPILICQASFQIQQPSPLQHHFTMPTVPFPEELLTAEELIQKYLSSPNLAENAKQGLSNILAEEIPIEIKPVNPPDFYGHIAMEPKKLFWVRARGHIGEGNMKLHCCVAAYVSDFAFLGTALLPYPQYSVQFSASLDHAMWFHSTFRADQWMLYECESPWAGGSRGLVQGRLWRRDGVLAASCAQEGVLRVKERSKL
ncbi:acyl-coenzyme A thioesterase 8 isoform X1 [Scleropages formosus]|uniref:Acyl-coenzyme A thioesterase 8 n=1 Tax=Scleropages formosus TaxID=113540 RepID=A0A8C9RVW5_SCLFO|nr:acyl-coenzyme A thioesterase 8 isoform X1 [Scleropages formosus]